VRSRMTLVSTLIKFTARAEVENYNDARPDSRQVVGNDGNREPTFRKLMQTLIYEVEIKMHFAIIVCPNIDSEMKDTSFALVFLLTFRIERSYISSLKKDGTIYFYFIFILYKGLSLPLTFLDFSHDDLIVYQSKRSSFH
jgi:hypothetical protein